MPKTEEMLKNETIDIEGFPEIDDIDDQLVKFREDIHKKMKEMGSNLNVF